MNECDFGRSEQAERQTGPDGGGVGNVNQSVAAAVEPLDEAIIEESYELSQARRHAAVGVAGKLQSDSVLCSHAGNAGLVRQ